MIVGLLWQALLSALILYREHGTLRPKEIRYRTGPPESLDLRAAASEVAAGIRAAGPRHQPGTVGRRLVGRMLVRIVGNYLYGEELLFRSVLLPKMRGVFGKWDWLASALLFGLYHVHKPWIIPGAILTGMVYRYPSRRFRCAWSGVIVHGADGPFLMFVIFSLVLGLQ